MSRQELSERRRGGLAKKSEGLASTVKPEANFFPALRYPEYRQCPGIGVGGGAEVETI